MPNVLLVHAKVNAGSVKKLIAFAKAHPDRLNYASQGSGTSGHLCGELGEAQWSKAPRQTALRTRIRPKHGE